MTVYEAIKQQSGCIVVLTGSRMRGTHRPDSDHDYLCIFDDDKFPHRTRISFGSNNYSITAASKFQSRLNQNDLHAIEIYLSRPELRERFRCEISPTKIEQKRKSINAFTNSKANAIDRIGKDSQKTRSYIEQTNQLCERILKLVQCGELPMQQDDDGNDDEPHHKPLPPIHVRAANYTTAQDRHTAAGRPLASQATIDERLSICVTCPEYNVEKSACSKCGCNINASRNAWKNKLAMANERCPMNPPKWEAEVSSENSV